MIGWIILLSGITVIGWAVWMFIDPIVPVIVTPCPYCGNPNRLDNSNAVAKGLSGHCEYKSMLRSAPCICDQWWVSRFGEIV